MNLTVKRAEKGRETNFIVTGEGVEAQVWYLDKWSISVKGKGSRKAKTEILEAVQNFNQEESKSYQAKKEQEQQEKIETFRQSKMFKNIDLLGLYNAEVFYYDSYHGDWMNYNKLLTGAEVKSKYEYVIDAEKVEIKNTDIYKIEVQKSIAVADERIFSVGGGMMGKIQLVTGLTLKEKLFTGLKTYGNVRKAVDVELRMLEQLGSINKTAFVLGDTIDLSDELEQAERYVKEMKRAKETTKEPTQPIKFTKDGQQIQYAWFISKPCQFSDLKDLHCATYDKYVKYEEITVSKEIFDQFKDSFNMALLNSNFKGGTFSDIEINKEYWEMSEQEQGEFILNSWRGCLEVKCDDYDFSLLVDPQGYDYGRYVAVLQQLPTTPEDDRDINKNNDNITIESVEVEAVVSASPFLQSGNDHNSDNRETLATYTLNEDKNGIEVKFSDKPSEEVRQELKENGFRWSKYQKIWYAKQSPERIDFVNKLCNISDNSECLQTLDIVEDGQHDRQIEPYQVSTDQLKVNLQHFSSTPTIDDVLTMFDEVDTNENNMITDEDRKHLEEIEVEYKNVIETINNHIEQYEEIKKNQKYEFVREFCQIDPLKKAIINVREKFVWNVCKYFTDKYNVKLEKYKLCDKYKHQNVTLNEIISDILETLGGLTFKELEDKQIKENLASVSPRESKLQKDKVVLSGFLTLDDISIKYGNRFRLSYYSKDKFQTLVRAIKHYNNVEAKTLEEFYTKVANAENDELITTHKLNLEKIKNIKLYKNGRVDIQFNNSDNAQKFFREYIQK